MEPEENLLKRTYELARENNRMLRSQRRSAWIGGIVKLIVWAFLIIAPLWFYMQYIQPVMVSAVDAMSQVQEQGAAVNAQFSQFGDAVKQLQNIPGFGQYFGQE